MESPAACHAVDRGFKSHQARQLMPRLTSQEIDEVVELLKAADEPDVIDRLTDWEQNFLPSVAEQFARTEWLSENQINRLKQIVEGRDGRSDRQGGSTFSRPKKLSYGSGETNRSSGGGFSGFDRSRSGDKSGDND